MSVHRTFITAVMAALLSERGVRILTDLRDAEQRRVEGKRMRDHYQTMALGQEAR